MPLEKKTITPHHYLSHVAHDHQRPVNALCYPDVYTHKDIMNPQLV
jgi:hypothetical protein